MSEMGLLDNLYTLYRYIKVCHFLPNTVMCTLFPPTEFATLQKSMGNIVTALDRACYQSMDLLDGPALVISYYVMTGRPGHSWIEFNTEFLTEVLDLKGPSHIAPMFQR